VADRWQVEKSTIYRMISSGKLPAFRVGKEFRVTDRAVREYEEGAV
jgi:excisionase family DNA binding protein